MLNRIHTDESIQVLVFVQAIMKSNLLRNLYPAYAEIGELLTRGKKYAA